MSLGKGKSRRKERNLTPKDEWEECIAIGGETVYCFLHNFGRNKLGTFVAVATVVFQLAAFGVFFVEAYKCGVENSPDCRLTGGFLNDLNLTASQQSDQQVNLPDSVTPLGLVLGILISLTFLSPDFMKGVVFAIKGYHAISAVHFVISITAMMCVSIYTISTATSDIDILTNVVVLLFISDFDEKMFDIYRAIKEINKEVSEAIEDAFDRKSEI